MSLEDNSFATSGGCRCLSILLQQSASMTPACLQPAPIQKVCHIHHPACMC
uniref:Uncharacterized protein n=1 Tax=Anguilla anguilla TaxID=7936 RepID=A0A0E9RAQ7_ANGAN